MNPPSRIKTFTGTLAVVQVNELEADGKKTILGKFDPQADLVYLLRFMSPAQKRQVLTHELTHKALYDFSISNDISDKLEERICDAMSGFFNHLISSNPSYVNYLKGR